MKTLFVVLQNNQSNRPIPQVRIGKGKAILYYALALLQNKGKIFLSKSIKSQNALKMEEP